MNNVISMSAEFEKKKNVKALTITACISAGILALVMLISWTIPSKIDPPPVEQFVEINLGSDLDGFGSDQPMLPGEGAPNSSDYTPAQPVQAAEESVKDVSSNDISNDAPPVTKPVVSKTDAKKISEPSKVVKSDNTVQKDVVQEQKKPKIVMSGPRGGNGVGGNGADSYQRGGNEGDGNGNGDKGVNGGNPNGTRYTGPRNIATIKVINIPPQNYEDDFNESGKVMLDIVVNASGKLTAATYQPKGSTITNRNQIEIAKRRAAQGTYPKYEGGFRQTIQVNFTVRG